MKSTLITALLLAILLAAHTNAANILCLMGVASPGYQLWHSALFKALTASGRHQLTVVSADLAKEPLKNVNFIHLERTYEHIQAHNVELKGQPYEPTYAYKKLLAWYERPLYTCRGTLSSEGFQTAIELQSVQKRKFDLILYDVTHGPSCLLSLAQLYPSAPIVGVSAFKLTAEVFEMARSGGVEPAFVPHFVTGYGVEMSYLERLHNTALYAFAHFFKQQVANPVIQGMLSKNSLLQQARILMSVESLKERFKLVLVNSNPAIDYIQPLPPNVVQVGGLQMTATKALPAALQSLFDEARSGVVLISFGLDQSLQMLGEARIEAILNIIKRFPQYIFLWRVEDGKLGKQTPKNLHLSSWLPQNDILANTKTKAFLTHAGSMSLQEAIYHGVPVITLPFQFDQLNNARRASDLGFGINLSLAEFDVESLRSALASILTNSAYGQNAKRLQAAYKNQPQKPLDTAVWWIEKLLENPKSFDHLVPQRVADLSTFVQHSWDVIALVVAFLMLLAINTFMVIRQLIRGFREKKKPKQEKEDKLEKLKSTKKKREKAKKN